MKKRMNVLYLNANMEGVRQVALKHFKDIYKEFLEKINDIIADVELDMKGSQKLSKEEDELLYYEGHWVGMDAVRVDYLLSLKEELDGMIKEND